jgi:hypothetical protein
MKMERVGSPAKPVVKVALLTMKDQLEYERIRNELVKVLQKMGGYKPAVDDIYIDQIARIAIYAKRAELYLDTDTATLDTYFRVTDTKLKQAKMIDTAIHQLARARRDRIGKQTESSLMNQLRQAVMRELKPVEQ